MDCLAFSMSARWQAAEAMRSGPKAADTRLVAVRDGLRLAGSEAAVEAVVEVEAEVGLRLTACRRHRGHVLGQGPAFDPTGVRRCRRLCCQRC
jgi:hypothetical protein